MKFLFDFFPVLLFFLAYKMYGIYEAVAVAIVASFIQVGLYWYRHRRFENLHLISLAVVAIFGGLTLALQDETFIKWKPSIVNWLFGLVFLASQFIGKKNLVETLMSSSLTLPSYIWPRLNIAWSIFFIALGFVNLYVMSFYDTDTWVEFKVFGMMGLTLGFIVVQGIYLAPHVQAETVKERSHKDSGENTD
ncbi:septation protein A [Kaarinaea lacus]